MAALSLYEITDELTALLDGGIDPETGEMSEELGAAMSKFEGKGKAVAAYVLNQNVTADAIDETIKKLEKRAQAFRKRAKAIKVYLYENMKRASIKQISADDGSFTVTLYLGRDESVEILDSKQIPVAYMTTPKTPDPTPDRARIKTSLKAGTDVPGARLLKKDRLTIS